jgi:hypothetical protein
MFSISAIIHLHAGHGALLLAVVGNCRHGRMIMRPDRIRLASRRGSGQRRRHKRRYHGVDTPENRRKCSVLQKIRGGGS